jgi:hypothetical protein
VTLTEILLALIVLAEVGQVVVAVVAQRHRHRHRNAAGPLG